MTKLLDANGIPMESSKPKPRPAKPKCADHFMLPYKYLPKYGGMPIGMVPATFTGDVPIIESLELVAAGCPNCGLMVTFSAPAPEPEQ